MDITKRPFQIKITEAGEIRMGSPYNHCNIELIGAGKIKLPVAGWQDKYAWSDDSKYLVLVKWNFENNNPGFHFFIINTETGQTKESDRILGLPNTISVSNGKIKVNKFLFDKTKSRQTELCCHIDQEFEFTI